MSSPHVPVDPALALDAGFRYVEDYLRVVDPELRLRKSINEPGFFVLERRCSRSRPVQVTRGALNDGQVAARDGYVHVTTVHRVYLDAPQLIVTALKEDGFDLYAEGGAAGAFQKFLTAKAEAKAVRRLKRDQDRRAFFREAFDLLNRTGGEGGTERTRISAAGAPWLASPDGRTSCGKFQAEEAALSRGADGRGLQAPGVASLGPTTPASHAAAGLSGSQG